MTKRFRLIGYVKSLNNGDPATSRYGIYPTELRSLPHGYVTCGYPIAYGLEMNKKKS
jgi:hypothetical protein